MHRDLLSALVANVRKRAAEGDCPVTPSYPVETLENAILDLAAEAPAEGAGEKWRYHTEPLQAAEDALKALDDVDELVRFCSVSMLDTERYYRGAEAMWRVAHWIAGVTPDEKSLNEEVSWFCKNCKTEFRSTMKSRVPNGFDDHGTGPACPGCKAVGQFTYRVGFHLGDPCIHCASPHDEVAVGPCSMSSDRARSSAPEARS